MIRVIFKKGYLIFSYKITLFFSSFILLLSLSACGGGSSSDSTVTTVSNTSSDTDLDSKYAIEYKGLVYYKPDMAMGNYKLEALTDDEFNTFDESTKLRIADKLLCTLFFSYPTLELKQMVEKGDFLQLIETKLQNTTNDIEMLESAIVDESKIYRPIYHQETIDILSRFYLAKNLDKYYFENWMAYILTQTIMFSPAYELDSSHNPNVASVYNRLVLMIEDESTIGYITYVHMSSEDNWRRFRSPEDNGREMLEIFTYDDNDEHVPIAATALKNWRLDRDNDTLVVGLNVNTKPLTLFGTTIYNGDDFYRELAKSSEFQRGVVSRLVNFFFTEDTLEKQDEITEQIIASNPQTWKDILQQIVFSKEYLLHTSRVKSAEEMFYSFVKKTNFQINKYTIYEFKKALESMNQASMKYKLGKLERVPLDTLSFINYDKYLRRELLLRYSNTDYLDDYSSWSRQGWSDTFIANENFEIIEDDAIVSLENFINYLFNTLLHRNASIEELKMFETLMLEENDGIQSVNYLYNILDDRIDSDGNVRGEVYKRYVALIVLDYITRIEDIFLFEKVE